MSHDERPILWEGPLDHFTDDQLATELRARGWTCDLVASVEVVAAPIDFDAFWDAYPRKVGKKAARKSWTKMSNAERRAAVEAIGQHVEAWWREGRSSATVPYPATWLNGEHWDDEIGFTPERPTEGTTRDNGMGAIQRRLAR